MVERSIRYRHVVRDARRERQVHTVGTPRREFMGRASLGLLSAVAVLGAAPSANADEIINDVTGAWDVAVQVEQPAPAQYDALYAFAAGGAFFRIDGRNNAPALGEWRMQEDNTTVITALLYSFDTDTSKRLGTITGYFQTAVNEAGKLIGSFSAVGTALDGSTLPGFPKSGTFIGSRIRAQAPV